MGIWAKALRVIRPPGRRTPTTAKASARHAALAIALAVALPQTTIADDLGSASPLQGNQARSKPDAMLMLPGRTASSVIDFGAKCDGATDDTNAIQLAASSVKAGALYIPVGRTCIIASASITVNGPLFSFPGGGTIKFPHDLGRDKAGIYVQGPWVENINLVGPGGTSFPGAGKTPAQMDGLQVGVSPTAAPQPFLRGLNVQGFHSALVYNTNYGHIRLADSLITNNYYGVYMLSNAGDTKVQNSEIVGQAMAGIACPADSHCLDGNCIITGTHIGFSPYGIYQEAGNSANGGFMSGCLLEEVHFESIGNAAIKSAAIANEHLGPSLDSTYIIHPGFLWDESRRYALAASITYAIDVPFINGQLRIDQGAFPLTPGSSGVVIHAQNCTGRVVLNYDGPPAPPRGSAESPAPLLVVDNPANQGCVWASRVQTASLSPSGLTPYADITVASGRTVGSTTFPTSSYAMSAKGIQPICTPAADPGSRWWITVAESDNQTTVAVHLSSAPAEKVSFYCHLTDQG
ncbi:MAG: hypothetical protein ACLQJR_15460 [Stellaceae bacterium]